jgi:uncharacterized membrane-anchored protein
MSARVAILWAGLVLVLATVGGLVLHKEHILAEGEPLLLSLAPVDPRSLVEGDYMSLRYAITADQDWPTDGLMVLGRDAKNVGSLVGRYRPGQALGPGEILLRYRRRGYVTRLGAEAFYFQEGTADRYRDAKYGELRVASSGESVLVGLRDKDGKVLGAP